MSNEAITWAYRQPITSGAKFVLVALADMADEEHSCFPGQAKLAAMTGQGERTVRRQLAELEEAGYIKRERRFGARGFRTSDRYMLPIPTGQIGQWPNRPVAILASPTGQIGQVTQREPKDTPQPPASGGPANPETAHCERHSKRRKGCTRCDQASRRAIDLKRADEMRRSDAVFAESRAAAAAAVPRPKEASQ